jgi:uncharacterized membrane protein YhaH (DUF805 family)
MFPRRIGRVSFLVRYVLFLLAAVIASVLLKAGEGKIVLLSLAILILLFALFYFIRFILVARVRDTGLHTAFALLILVPLVNFLFVLVLLFVPADQFKKKDETQ